MEETARIPLPPATISIANIIEVAAGVLNLKW